MFRSETTNRKLHIPETKFICMKLYVQYSTIYFKQQEHYKSNGSLHFVLFRYLTLSLSLSHSIFFINLNADVSEQTGLAVFLIKCIDFKTKKLKAINL